MQRTCAFQILLLAECINSRKNCLLCTGVVFNIILALIITYIDSFVCVSQVSQV